MKETARLFKVLADEARLQMLWLLFAKRELCVCDIMAVLEITQSKASRHLAALRNAGLVSDRRDGLWSYYSLRPLTDPDLKAQLKLLHTSLSKREDAKQLLSKLHFWLKEKKSDKTAFQCGSLVRAIKNARNGSVQTRPSGGIR